MVSDLAGKAIKPPYLKGGEYRDVFVGISGCAGREIGSKRSFGAIVNLVQSVL